MFRARGALLRFKPLRSRQFCSNDPKPTNSNASTESNVSRYHEAYKQLDKLDFMTAAKILFSEPPKKKFGLDFHLVQLFFACMPSLAVYLVAQYARHEMRKMDAELELKKKKEEEEKAKEMEQKAIEEKARFNPELLEVKERLGKLEETVKEIAVESKKQLASSAKENRENNGERKHAVPTEPDSTQHTEESRKLAERNHPSNHKSVEPVPDSVPGKDPKVPKVTGSVPTPDASQQG